jgi:hypothetical protein
MQLRSNFLRLNRDLFDVMRSTHIPGGHHPVVTPLNLASLELVDPVFHTPDPPHIPLRNRREIQINVHRWLPPRQANSSEMGRT